MPTQLGEGRREHRGPILLHPDDTLDPAEDEIAAANTDDGHVQDVGPQRHQAAVGEHQALYNENAGDDQNRGARSEQYRRQDSAHQMAGRAAGHGKIQHLGGENECCRQPEHGHLAWLQTGPHLAQGEAHSSRGHARA